MDKRYVKITGLAAVLVLCLLLTGCYQPPDEVNNGQPAGVATSSFFNTLAPTPTVTMTPDVIPIQTQNIYGGLTGTQVTPTPTAGSVQSGPWDNWGTTPVPQNTAGINVFDSPAPSDGSPTIAVIAVIALIPIFFGI